MEQAAPIKKTYTVFFVFSGEGGGALGAVQALPAILGDASATCEVIGGIDVDELACQDFEMWTGVRATCLDLFDRDQYIKWHGHEPPADWQEATPDDLRRAAGYRNPDIVIITAPCKGFSGLLGKDTANTPKYQALNRLAERALFLVLETWRPAFLGVENVKGFTTRGATPLSKMLQLLEHYRYLWYQDHYDCGEWGGLSQHRKRFLGFARDPEQVPCFLYNPPKKQVQPISKVLERMPMPIDPDLIPKEIGKLPFGQWPESWRKAVEAWGGPMHVLSRLQWRTQVRLALIPPGGDWRDLLKIQPGQYTILPIPNMPKHFQIVETASLTGAGAPITGPMAMEGFSEDRTHHVKYHIQEVDDPSATVTGQTDIQTGAPIIADPRQPHHMDDPNAHPHQYHVQDMTEPGSTVTASRMGSGMGAVADPRSNWFDTSHRVTPVDEPAPTITGQGSPSGAAVVIADPNPLGHTPMGHGKGAYLVQDVNDPSGTITGDPSHRKSGGASCIADPRLEYAPRDAAMRVGDTSEPSGPIIGSAAVTSSNGMGAIADPRITEHGSNFAGSPGLMGVLDGNEPSNAITGAAAVTGSNCPAAVADPRYAREPRSGVYAVQDTGYPSRTITAGKDPNGNMLLVADPRHRQGKQAFNNMLHMNDSDEPAQAITAASGPNQSATLVADPRYGCEPRGNSKGPLGVQPWDQASGTVCGAGDVHAGAGVAAVADPRPPEWPAGATWDCRIPADDERGVWYIISPHVDKQGRHCWHRPLTTLELLALQSFPWRHSDGRAVVLAGKSDRSWRERIGNAWPPLAAAAVIGNMLMSLLASETVGFLWDYQQTGVLVEPATEPPGPDQDIA